jgi:hypothetical protein
MFLSLFVCIPLFSYAKVVRRTGGNQSLSFFPPLLKMVWPLFVFMGGKRGINFVDPSVGEGLPKNKIQLTPYRAGLSSLREK